MSVPTAPAPPVPATPLEAVPPALSGELGVDLRIKRDDLYPVPGGGNKGRKLRRVFRAAEEEDADSVVTTGGESSNHARVTAQLAAVRGWPCHLVVHRRAEGRPPPPNRRLAELYGATVEVVDVHEMGERVEAAMGALRGGGRRPYWIPGGAHCREGGLAYVEAAEEVDRQLGKGEPWRPDQVVLASGTGATQAGLIVGAERVGWAAEVMGVSVARDAKRGEAAVAEMVDELLRHFGMGTPVVPWTFEEDWRAGGYEGIRPEVLGAVERVGKLAGVPLDPTYTGKAFWGLRELIQAGRVPRGARVLFWHTGGLLNLVGSMGEWR